MTRNQYVVVLTVAAAFLGFDLSQPFLPLYVRELGATEVGAAALWSGLLVGITPLLVALLGPFWGGLADRFGARNMVLRALVAISLCCAALAAAPDLWSALAARTVMGIFGGFTPMAMALAVRAGPRDRAGQVIGLLQAAQFLPLAIGPPIGGLVSDRFGLRANFAMTASICIVASAVLVVLYRMPATPAESTRPARREPAGRAGTMGLLAVPGFLATLLILFATQFADRSLTPILPLYLDELGTPRDQLATVTGLVISGGAVAAAGSSTLYGRLAKPGTTRRIMLLSLVGGAVFMAPLAFARSWEQVLVLRLLLGLLAGGSVGLAYTLGTRIAPAERAGLAIGLLSSCSGLGSAISPFVSGVLGRISLDSVFLVSAALYVVALVLALVGLRSRVG